MSNCNITEFIQSGKIMAATSSDIIKVIESELY